MWFLSLISGRLNSSQLCKCRRREHLSQDYWTLTYLCSGWTALHFVELVPFNEEFSYVEAINLEEGVEDIKCNK
jgi:hypothetical protein